MQLIAQIRSIPATILEKKNSRLPDFGSSSPVVGALLGNVIDRINDRLYYSKKEMQGMDSSRRRLGSFRSLSQSRRNPIESSSNIRFVAQAKAGVTLVELLTVISIAAILAAIAFPILRGIEGEVEKNIDISNLKQLDSAVLMYSQDYDEHLPLSARIENGENINWANFINPYVKNSVNKNGGIQYSGVYRCPTQKKGHPSYGYNDWLSRNAKYLTLASIQSPGAFLFFAEMKHTGDPKASSLPNGCLGDTTNDNGDRFWDDTYQAGLRIHLGASVAAFSDGHVKTWKRQKGVNSVSGLEVPGFPGLTECEYGSEAKEPLIGTAWDPDRTE